MVIFSDGCETIYEIGHCWTGVNAGQKLITSCPTIDPLKAAKSIYNTSRICFEAGEIQNTDGTTQYLPIGWEDIGDFFFPGTFTCQKILELGQKFLTQNEPIMTKLFRSCKGLQIDGHDGL